MKGKDGGFDDKETRKMKTQQHNLVKIKTKQISRFAIES